jgi:NADH-quinone oxidoreductase subunit G
MAAIAPQLAEVDAITTAPWEDFGEVGAMDDAPFTYPVDDFYRTDAISRASPVMAECSVLHAPTRSGATGTDG